MQKKNIILDFLYLEVFFLEVMNEIYKREDISFLFYVIKFIITHEIRG